MADLSTNYLGLKLKSPIIVSSCSLTSDPEKAIQMERDGAGAIVVKSLFEEQIRNEVEFLSRAGESYPEMDDYLHAYVRGNSITTYTDTIRSLKQVLSIPVIASINCYSQGEWVFYAKEIEKAGADALEINLYEMPVKRMTVAEEVERGYCSVVQSISKEISIPIAVKIGRHFTSLVSFVERLVSCGAKGVVIFNRFFTPDIDLDRLTLTPSHPLSSPEDYLETLRWCAILSSQIKNIDISASTGIHTSDTVIKQILAGAESVQVCSVIYKRGISVIRELNSALERFMKEHNFLSTDQMRGKLNYSSISDPAMYERVQFMKNFGSLH